MNNQKEKGKHGKLFRDALTSKKNNSMLSPQILTAREIFSEYKRLLDNFCDCGACDIGESKKYGDKQFIPLSSAEAVMNGILEEIKNKQRSNNVFNIEGLEISKQIIISAFKKIGVEEK